MRPIMDLPSPPKSGRAIPKVIALSKRKFYSGIRPEFKMRYSRSHTLNCQKVGEILKPNSALHWISNITLALPSHISIEDSNLATIELVEGSSSRTTNEAQNILPPPPILTSMKEISKPTWTEESELTDAQRMKLEAISKIHNVVVAKTTIMDPQMRKEGLRAQLKVQRHALDVSLPRARGWLEKFYEEIELKIEQGEMWQARHAMLWERPTGEVMDMTELLNVEKEESTHNGKEPIFNPKIGHDDGKSKVSATNDTGLSALSLSPSSAPPLTAGTTMVMTDTAATTFNSSTTTTTNTDTVALRHRYLNDLHAKRRHICESLNDMEKRLTAAGAQQESSKSGTGSCEVKMQASKQNLGVYLNRRDFLQALRRELEMIREMLFAVVERYKRLEADNARVHVALKVMLKTGSLS